MLTEIQTVIKQCTPLLKKMFFLDFQAKTRLIKGNSPIVEVQTKITSISADSKWF